jgi:hypothetical protein
VLKKLCLYYNVLAEYAGFPASMWTDQCLRGVPQSPPLWDPDVSLASWPMPVLRRDTKKAQQERDEMREIGFKVAAMPQGF